MAYVPFGSLGGLGGAPQIPAPEPNQFQQFVGAPGFGNALQALGMSLMSSPSNNPLQGFAPALQMTQAQTMQEQEAAEREEARQAAEDEKKQWAQYAQSVVPEQLKGLAATDPKGALQIWQQMQPQGMDPTANMQNVEYLVSQGVDRETAIAQVFGGSGGAGQIGTTIYTGRDANGNIVPMQVGQAGFVPAPLPEGVTFDPGALNAERAAGTTIGKEAAGAAIDLPTAVADTQRIGMQISDLKNHPGLDAIFGKTFGIIPNQWGPTFPGTDKANAMARIEQMSGNAFLNGRQLLKGGGAITDMESNKAEAAFARLSQAQTKEEFIRGLDEFNEALAAGVAKLHGTSGLTQFTGGQRPSPVAPDGWVDTGNGIRIRPKGQ